MASFKKVPEEEHQGKITLNSGILDGIVILAISEVDDVKLDSTAPRKQMKSDAIKVSFTSEGVSVDVAVKIHFSQCVSDMAFKIQEAVRHSVESMTEFHISSVNVKVTGVLFDDVASV